MKKIIILLLVGVFGAMSFWSASNPPLISNNQVLPPENAKFSKGACLKKYLDNMENPIFLEITGVDNSTNSYETKIFIPKKAEGVTDYEITSSKLSFSEAHELAEHPYCPRR